MIGRSLASLVLVAASGFALSELVPSLRARRLAARLAYGYVLGAAALGISLYALSHVFRIPIGRGAVLALTLSFVILGLVTRGRRGAARRSSDPGMPLGLALVLAILSLALLADAVTNPVLEWDGRAIWGAHARFIRAEKSVDPVAIRDARYSVEVPRHPVLMPVLQAAGLETLGADDDDRLVRPLYSAFFPAFLVILFDEARRRAGRLAASLATLSAALVPQFSFETYGGAAGTYSDLPLACFFGAGLVLLSERNATWPTAAAAGLLLSAGILTKDEGLALALLGILAASLRALRIPSIRKRVVLAAAIALLAVMLLASWKHGVADRLDPNFDPDASADHIASRVSARAAQLPVPLLLELHDRHDWGFFWIAAPLLAFAGRAAFSRRSARPLVLVVAGALAVYSGAFLTTRLNPLWLIPRTESRFLVQISLPLLVLLAGCIRETGRGRRRPAHHLKDALALLAALLVAVFPLFFETLGLNRDLSREPPASILSR